MLLRFVDQDLEDELSRSHDEKVDWFAEEINMQRPHMNITNIRKAFDVVNLK